MQNGNNSVLPRLEKVNTPSLEARTTLCLCAGGYSIPRREGLHFRVTDNRPVSYQALTAFAVHRYAETLLEYWKPLKSVL
jgi:hypothetical protein